MKKAVSVICMAICFLSFSSGISYSNPYDVTGDVNGDRKIDLREAIYALQVVSGIQTGEPATNSETEPNDSLASADTIGIGYSNPISNATILPLDDVDYYKFTTTGNQTFVIETFDIISNTIDNATGIYLLDSNGLEIANDESGANGTNNVNASLTYTFSAAGTFYIMVAHDRWTEWTGNYSLRILPKYDEAGAAWDAIKDMEPNDQLEIANEIELGLYKAQTHLIDPNSSDFVNNGNDHDWYHFEAVAGRTYVIESFDITYNTFEDATGIYLYDENGVALANDESGLNGTNTANARITHTFSRSGTYFVLVTNDRWREWAGTYSIRILPKYDEPGAAWNSSNDNEPNDELVLANPIGVGLSSAQTHQLNPFSNSYVNNGSDHDWYRFSADAFSTYVMETFNTQADNATGTYLYDGNGIELANDDSGNNGTGNINAHITYTFSQSGTYFLLVTKDRWVDWSGTYSVRVYKQ